MKKIEEKFKNIILENYDHANGTDFDGIVEDSTHFTTQLLQKVWNERTHYDSLEEALLYIFKKQIT